MDAEDEEFFLDPENGYLSDDDDSDDDPDAMLIALDLWIAREYCASDG
jgi:hypothetical protein